MLEWAVSRYLLLSNRPTAGGEAMLAWALVWLARRGWVAV